MTNWRADKDTALHKPAKKKRSHKQELRDRLTKDISRKWPTSKLGATGFYNPSMWCYRNSILQAMMHLPIFLNWIKTHQEGGSSCADAAQAVRKRSPRNSRPTRRCIACAFKRLSEVYWGEPRNTTNIENERKAFNRIANAAGWQYKSEEEQADTHDFITELINHLAGGSGSPAQMPVDMINAIFKVELQTRRKCMRKGCGHIHTPQHTDQEFGLSIGITDPGKNLNISKYLDRYFQTRTDADAKCDKCHSKSSMPRIATIEAAPEVLLVQLKRFQTEMVRRRGRVTGVRTTKLDSDVHFDVCLDLSKYQTNPAHREAGSLRYKLSSVVYHRGDKNGGTMWPGSRGRWGCGM
ncbi:hypothetical protein H2199_005025 [Coniosporium tulheliwenetii]|uniref:Uncharacterized protein n=1 Tax=Coniosporium tulheliwenetii TaxID=3383036 RepID=A0ACC2Z271_9PEZI|nr:hypothetical protein H2199_005025 [Cladosporium sp. JES 115]